MISKGDGTYITISLKTAMRESENPPIRNTTVNIFLNYCNLVSNSKKYNIIDSFFMPIIKYAQQNKLFTQDEINNLIKFKASPNKLTNYINNSDVAAKLTKIRSITFICNKLIN